MSQQTVISTPPGDWPGFYGKIPARGDFISRRLPRKFIDPWDTWLQEAIANSREQLGEHWLENYLTSPVWRFVLSPGICGESGWAGLLMPSVDRVGRYYPLTLCTPLNPSQNIFLLLEQSDSWFSGLERLALSSLEDDFQLDNFELQLQTLGGPPTLEHSDTDKLVAAVPDGRPRHNAWHTNLDSQPDIRSSYPLLLPQLLKRLLFAYSLWWTSGSERVLPSLLLCQGLPHIQGYSALIDGCWDRHGWEEIDSHLFAMDQSGGNSR